MTYVILLLILIPVMLIYFRLADCYNIIDKPSQRSSHSTITIRGGGIVFPIAVLLWFLFFNFPYPWFTTGLLLIAGISFLDDIFTLSTKPRLAVHLISVALMLHELIIFSFAWYWWVIALILIIGWLNAFNFMDGINGITAFYTLAVLLPLLWINRQIEFIEASLLYVTCLATVVFAFFNARKRALCFAGDVGSVSLAFILAFLLIRLIIHTGHWEYILFFAVYGVDAVLTIIHRLLKGENIFKAHRSHFYQYLANELGWLHIRVSGLYATLQLLISALTIRGLQEGWHSAIFIGLLLGLVILYVLGKRHMLRSLAATV